jgi:hypothetical protein
MEFLMPTFKREIVTPQFARRLLGVNVENNRLPKTSKIPMYARDMQSGRWNSDTGETIKIDVNGRLVDGQNRMHAVIMADVPIEFDFAYDVPAEAMVVIDTGSARTAADVLHIDGAPDRARSASIARWVILWDAKVYLGRGGQFNPTTTEVIERYRSDAAGFDAATRRGGDCQRMSLGTGSVAGVAHYLFARIEKERAEQFFDQYISGANLPKYCGPLALRNKMARAMVDRITRAEQLALFIRAWNAFREERTLERMTVVRAGDLNNINFPQPL